MSTVVVIGEEGAEASQSDLPVHLDQNQQTAAASNGARTECLALCTTMYRKLPRGLRDLVYSYLCFEDRQIPIGPYYHFRKYEPHAKNEVTYSDTQYFPRTGDLQTELSDGQTRIDHDVYPPDDLLLPQNHIFNPGYMGENVVLETLKTYYESNSFSVCNIEGGLDGLCASLVFSSDGSTTEFRPLDYIHDLQIRVKYEHLRITTESIACHPSIRLEDFAAQELLLRDSVESLLKFRSKIQTSSHHLNIEVVLLSDVLKCQRRSEGLLQGYVINILQSVRNMVYELLHDRNNTTIRVTHQDDSLMAFPKNYTGLFQLTKEQWQFEQSRQQPNHDWSQHFWVLPISSGEVGNPEELGLGGYYYESRGDLMSKRWGVSNILSETTSSIPIVESSYWPIGRPNDPRVTQEVAVRATQICLDK
ncbi:hypothetical protein OPT61_g9200 [Boeremia exigua]|uniref:Uncharacterized protein n=1 Tax=Boeremia exigua TaxID=749465 RepID=A0ACC2HW05_9PLEO|nr:hypothetical protein OPT61_g9200 [Boeremia exigua]